MARADQPSPDLPWVLRQKGLKLLEMRTNDQGQTELLFKSPLGPVREVWVTMISSEVVTWNYGYIIRDKGSRTRVTYSGKYGDPTKDDAIEIESA